MTTTGHGSGMSRWQRGAWPRCICGYNPRDNAKLNTHFADYGFQEVERHGELVQVPIRESRARPGGGLTGD